MSPVAKSGLMMRVITALVLLPSALALLWVPSLEWGFTLFVTIIAILGHLEYCRIAQKKEIDAAKVLAAIGCALVVLSAAWGRIEWTCGVLFAAMLVACAPQVVSGRASVASLAATFFGLIYVAWFGSHVLLLHQVETTGVGLVTVLFIAVILTDAAAYFVGKLLGKHKLAPKVSPNKTWEGAIGGALGAIAGLGILYGLKERYEWTAFPDWPLHRYLLTGAVLTVVSQLGDLMESSLKRSAGVKDSGTIFPGHGGVLDRCDGFLFAAPALGFMVLI